MKKWPEIKVEFNTTDKVLNGLILLITLGTAVYVASVWGGLPDRLPTHYTFNGSADAWGSKKSLWFIVGVMVFVNGMMVGFQPYPQWFNYPVNVTPENAQAQYRNAVRMMQVLGVVIGLFFAYTVYATVGATPEHSGLSPWALPVFLTGVFGPLAYFLGRGFSMR